MYECRIEECLLIFQKTYFVDCVMFPISNATLICLNCKWPLAWRCVRARDEHVSRLPELPTPNQGWM